MNQVSLTQMAQASQVLAVVTPCEGHRATTEGTGSEKATKCKYSTTQREEGHRAKGMPNKAIQGKGNFIAVEAMSVEAERNTLLAECNRLRAANESLRAKFDYVMQSYCQAVVAVEMAKKSDTSKLEHIGTCLVIPITPSTGETETSPRNEPCAVYSLRG
mgnify:FL=1